MDTVKTLTSSNEYNKTKETPDVKVFTFKDEIKLVWKNFFLETSLHGCSSLPKFHYHWLRRLLWLIFVVASTTSLLVYVVEFYMAYNKYPYITKTRLERVQSLPLPAISICDAKYKKSTVNNSDILEEYFNSLANPYLNAFGEFNITVPLDEDIYQLNNLPMEEIGMKKEDVIMRAYINSQTIDVKSEFQSFVTFFGQCFTYNMVNENGEGGDITLSHGQDVHLILNISQETYFPSQYGGMMVTFHDPRDLPTPASVVVSVAPGFMNRIFLKATMLKFLPKPYKSYGEQDCVESTEPAPLEGNEGQKGYTLIGCIENCAIQYAVNVCKCTAKDVRGFSESMSNRICSTQEVRGCIFPHVLKIFYSFLIQQNQTKCNCPQPCESLEYDVRTSLMTFPSRPVGDFLVKHGAASSYQDLRDNYVSVEIRFDRMAMNHVEHVPEFSSSDVFGKLGGQMGLFLGASLLTLMEVAETVCLSLLILGKAVTGHLVRLKVGAVK